jgi:hypothetical protein
MVPMQAGCVPKTPDCMHSLYASKAHGSHRFALVSTTPSSPVPELNSRKSGFAWCGAAAAVSPGGRIRNMKVTPFPLDQMDREWGCSKGFMLWRNAAIAAAHPTAEWIARQFTEACGWEQAPTILIRDGDRAYGKIFIRRLRAMGIRDRPTSPRSPWQNGCAERLIGSIRWECI